jgi:hypothetical protein
MLDVMIRQVGRQREETRDGRQSRFERPARSFSHGAFRANAFNPL